MSQLTAVETKWSLASAALTDAWTDFILSRQAIRCSPNTLNFYNFTAGHFVKWAENNGATSPDQIDARLVRQYLAELAGQNKADRTLHAHARAIRTLLRFWNSEGYIPTPVKVDMPRIAKKRLPCPTAEDLTKIIKVCDLREKAIIEFLADIGLRRAEACALNWGDVNFQNGTVVVKRGKGGKARTAICGATARRALLVYRRHEKHHDVNDPLFQTKQGERLTGNALRLICKRLSEKSGVKFSAHALRRSFATLSLRGGMNVLHLQSLLGHASLDMVQHYAQMVDDDLKVAHEATSPDFRVFN